MYIYIYIYIYIYYITLHSKQGKNTAFEYLWVKAYVFCCYVQAFSLIKFRPTKSGGATCFIIIRRESRLFI